MSVGNGATGRAPRVFLGMPGYGRQTAAAGRALWRACRDMSAVYVKYQQGSLLAHNFNALWCAALTMAHHGRSPKYFAMLHDDIGVEDGWLDRLIAELEAKDLDVLGVVAPIKDSRGITSIALHREGDNWRPKCRLTMRDVYRLPATFTSDDLGAPLLLNTGCWVCKFDVAWARQVWFTVNDRIAFNTATNAYQAVNESEDWFFSRLLHEKGLRLGATRKLRLLHRGEMDFSNERPWGHHVTDLDSGCTESPVPVTDRDGFRFPFDVAGELGVDEGKELWHLAAGRRVVEIGSGSALATICMAQSAEHVDACSWWDSEDGGDSVLFLENVRRYGMEHLVDAITPRESLRAESYDLAFIDGSHEMDAVKADIARCLPALKPGGLLVFHDYGDHAPGVMEAVNELLVSGGELKSVTDTLAVVQAPALTPCEV